MLHDCLVGYNVFNVLNVASLYTLFVKAAQNDVLTVLIVNPL